MPCIQIKTNASVSEKSAANIKTFLGKSIENLPGKSEDWLMITLEDNCRMWFRGESERPMAIVEVKIFGNSVDKNGSAKMTAEVCGLFEKELGISPQDIYIRYIASADWGWNGTNF